MFSKGKEIASVNILGHGIDIVDVPRIAALLAKSDDLLFGWFTSRELEVLGSAAPSP